VFALAEALFWAVAAARWGWCSPVAGVGGVLTAPAAAGWPASARC